MYPLLTPFMKTRSLLSAAEEYRYGMQLQAVHEGISAIQSAMESFAPAALQAHIRQLLHAVIAGRQARMSSLTLHLSYQEKREDLLHVQRAGERARTLLVQLLSAPPALDIVRQSDELCNAVDALARPEDEASAFNALVDSNLPFAWWFAKKYAAPGVDIHDLASEAMIGLMRATCEFDPRKGSFAAYAKRILLGALTQFLRRDKVIRIPKHAAESASADQSTDSGSRVPMRISDADDQILLNMPNDENTQPADAMVTTEFVSRMLSALHTLPEVQRTILCLHFGINCQPLSLEEIGSQLGVTRERVRQIQEEAIRALRLDIVSPEDQQELKDAEDREFIQNLEHGDVPALTTLRQHFGMTLSEFRSAVAQMPFWEQYVLQVKYKLVQKEPLGHRKTAEAMGWTTEHQQRASALVDSGLRRLAQCWMKQKFPGIAWDPADYIERFPAIIRQLPQAQQQLLLSRHTDVPQAEDSTEARNPYGMRLQENRAMRFIVLTVMGRFLDIPSATGKDISEACLHFFHLLSEREQQALLLHTAPFHDRPQDMPDSMVIDAIRLLRLSILHQPSQKPKNPREAVLLQKQHFHELTDEESRVIHLRYGVDCPARSLAETANILGYRSTSKVVMEELRALKKLFAAQVAQEKQLLHRSPGACLAQIPQLLTALDDTERAVVEAVHVSALHGGPPVENRKFTEIGATIGISNDVALKAELRAFGKMFFAMNGVMTGEKLHRSTARQRKPAAGHRSREIEPSTLTDRPEGSHNT